MLEILLLLNFLSPPLLYEWYALAKRYKRAPTMKELLDLNHMRQEKKLLPYGLFFFAFLAIIFGHYQEVRPYTLYMLAPVLVAQVTGVAWVYKKVKTLYVQPVNKK